MNRQKLISILVIVLVYLIGLVSGSLVTRMRVARPFKPGIKIGRKMEDRMIKRLSSRLELTEEQQEKLRLISEKKQPQMEELRKDMKAEMKKIKDKWHQDIKEILTEEQAVKLDALMEKRYNHLDGKDRKRMGIRRQGRIAGKKVPAR